MMYDFSAAETEVAPGKARPDRPCVSVIRPTDGERLMRFRVHRDEASFREVVEMHASLVWGVCWQVLRHREDVEDAFQATFLILARKAAAIRAADSAAGWLYRVAFRTALAARARRRRLGAESQVESLIHEPPGSLDDQLASIERAEQCEALLEELHSLGDRFREPLVLCYLEGRTRQEAAEELGVTLASVKGRLARGLRMLRTRMACRGLALSGAAALLTGEMAAAKASLVTAPIAQAAALGSGLAWATATPVGVESTVSKGAILLANKGIVAMKLAVVTKSAVGLLAVGVTLGAMALAGADAPDGASSSAVGDEPSTAVVELTAADQDAATSAAHAGMTTITYTGTAAAEPAAAPAAARFEGTVSEEESGLLEVREAGGTGEGTLNIRFAGTSDSTVAEPAAEDEVVEERLEIAPPRAISPPYSPPPSAYYQPAPTISSEGHLSPASAKLEMEHWELKASGLRKRVEALQAKVKMLKQRDDDDAQVAALETDAEADLTLAEVKLCEAKAQRLKDSIAAAAMPQPIVQPPLTRAMTYPFYPTPSTAQPAQAVPTTAMPTMVPPTGSWAAPATADWTPPPPPASDDPDHGNRYGTPLTPEAAPLKIALSSSPTPARVGSRVVWEYKVSNLGPMDDYNVELRIATPDFLVVDPKTIDAPPQVNVRVQENLVTFSPVATLGPGESLMYRIPFTSRGPGTSVLKAYTRSKNYPQSVWIGAGISVDSEPTVNHETPAGPQELLEMVSELRRANEALERRLRELEGPREAAGE